MISNTNIFLWCVCVLRGGEKRNYVSYNLQPSDKFKKSQIAQSFTNRRFASGVCVYRGGEKRKQLVIWKAINK